MSAGPTGTVVPAPGRILQLGSREIPVVGPRLGDPRVRLSVIIISLHVLGQVRLGFKISIAQIAITILLAGLIDAGLVLWREGRLIWPASGILTGSGLAFILRANGTDAGDWWSLHGIWFYVAGVVLALLSKHLVRPRGTHLFNPSNVALVWLLLVVGPTRLFPQPLWWGDDQLGVALAYAILAAGAWWVLRPVRMGALALSFVVSFAVLVALVAASGASFVASWHDEPISGFFYWQTVAISPELLLFGFFMITDPQTTPRDPVGRVVFGVVAAAATAGLMWFQPTEFGVKLALLSSLVVTCASVPAIDELVSRVRVRSRSREGPAHAAGPPRPRIPVAGTAWGRAAASAAAIIAVAAPVNTARLAGDETVIAVERGLTAPGTGQ